MSKKITIQALRNRVSLALIAVLLMQQVVYSQLTVSIDQQFQCESTEVLVPVFVSDFNDVASIHLYIETNTQNLEFIDLVNKHALLSSTLGSSINNNGNLVIVITWQAGSPSAAISIDLGKLFDLKLLFKEGPATLHFRDDCEIGLSDLTIVNDAVFNDGIIEPVEIEITMQAQDQIVVEDETARFIIEQTGALVYQWQYYSGNDWSNLSDDLVFSGVTTQELIIANVPLEFNNRKFRCLVSINNNCYLASDEAMLFVNSLGINKYSGKTPVLHVYPNPFSNKLHYTFNTPANISSLQLFNLLGKRVYQSRNFELNESSVGIIVSDDLQPGLYFLQLIGDKEVLLTVKVIKQ